MNRNALVVVAGVVAAAAAAFFLLGGPSGIFGSGDRGRSDSSGAPPDEASATGAENATAPGSSAKGAVLFGRKRADLKGVGGLRAQVLHYGDSKPVVGARLTLSGAGYGGEAVNVVATTDPNGRAALDGVAAGDGFRLDVHAEGESPLFLPDVAVRPRATIDLGTIYLGARAALEGRVVDERGEGVAAADVRVFSGVASLAEMLDNMAEMFATLDREPKAMSQTLAARDGRFRIEDVAPGSITVRATAPGRVMKMAKVEMMPQGPAGGPVTLVLVAGVEVAGHVVTDAGRGIAGARVALLSEGGNDPLEFIYGRVFAETDSAGAFRATVSQGEKRLRAMVAAEGYPTSISQRIEAGDTDVKIVLSGGTTAVVTVRQKESGRPIAGAQVMLMVADSATPSDEGEGAMAFGLTDDSGELRLVTRPGHLQFGMVSAPGHASAMLNPMGEGMGAPGMKVEGTYSKELKAGVENRMEFRLSSGVTLVGKVMDAKGTPIGDAEVKLVISFGGANAVRSAADGSYRMDGVPASAMGLVRVRAAGWTQRMADMNLKLPPDATGEVPHDFTLYPSATVRGRVVDAASQPVPGAKVVFRSAGGGMMGLDSMFGGKSAITAADGTYVLYDVDQSSGFGAEMMMGASTEIVGDAPKAEPARSTVRVKATGYVEGRSAPFTVGEGAVAEAPLVTLSRGARITGVVVGPRGGPMPRARIEASFKREGDGPMDFDIAEMMGGIHTILAGDDGAFSLDTIAPGTATLTAFGDGASATRRTVKVEGEAPPPPVEIRMRPSLEVRGRVLDPDRRGIKGARVSIDSPAERTELPGGMDASDESYHEPVSTRTDAEGQFVLKPVPPTRVSIAVFAEGFKVGAAQVEAGTPPVDVFLVKTNPDDVKRLAEVDAEIAKLSQQFASVKDASERDALMKRLMDLMKEKNDLKGETPAEAVAPPR